MLIIIDNNYTKGNLPLIMKVNGGLMNLEYRVINEDNIDFIAPLCNKLMAFQGAHAMIHPEIMNSMTYENRLKKEYKNTKQEHMIVVFHQNIPIGFAYGTIGQVTKETMRFRPDWAADFSGMGFYPDNYDCPKSIGTFKLLYVDEEYRGHQIGAKLTQLIMMWLRSQPVDDLWVYVANGNEKVGQFYEKYGFKFSHQVFNGFIDAYTQINEESF
jgi:GNAT superfamily N-acetyltransferase